MFISLEGCDGSGKSTLVEEIIKEIEYRFPGEDIETLHYSQLKNDPIDEYALKFEDYAPGKGRHIICDRWAWGETIYGPLYRGKSALTEAQYRWVELYMKARGATTWHISAALETVQNRLKIRGEEYLQSHDVEHVWQAFQAVADRSLTTGGTILTDQASPDKLANLIVNGAIYAETSSAEVFRPEYIGRALPSFILVGDTQGNSDPGVTKAPFMPRGTSCGTFLLEALPERWWHQAGIVNARETDLPALIDSLYYPNVIALGSNAAEVLNDIEIEHSVVPHPQKIRRFYHGQKSEYGLLIRRASTERGKYLSWPK